MLNNVMIFFSLPADDELVYLDPHTTQPCIQYDKWGNVPDESYHCEQASRMRIQSLDPSIALVSCSELLWPMAYTTLCLL